MNDSDKFVEQYSDYIEGNLSPEACREFEQHLLESPELQEIVQRMRMVRESLNGLPMIEAQPDFENRLHHRINNMSMWESLRYSSMRYEGYKLPAAGFAVAAVVVLLFMFYPQKSVDVPITSPHESSFSPSFSGQEPVQAVPKSPEAAAASMKQQAIANDTTRRDKNVTDLKKNIKLVNEPGNDN